MPRRARVITPFDRDFADLYGHVPPQGRQPPIEHSDVRGGRFRPKVDQVGLRLIMGALGLFWTIVLGAALIAMLVIAWAFVTAALGV